MNLALLLLVMYAWDILAFQSEHARVGRASVSMITYVAVCVYVDIYV